jgi:hypothetical protein
MATSTTTGHRHKASGASPLAAKAQKAGPSQARLRRLAQKHRPPQSWYDETTIPFEPAKGCHLEPAGRERRTRIAPQGECDGGD